MEKYRICDDNIIRKKVGKKWNPSCPNELFQPLVVKKTKNVTLNEKEDTLYGQCILSLIEIVLNNCKFRYQKEEIKDECRGEMLHDVLVAVPKYFDETKGSTAYSYAFRVCYVAGIHVLEKMNKMNELFEKLDDNKHKINEISEDFIETNLI